MYEANLSCELIEKYTSNLTAAGLLMSDEKVFTTTETGKKYIGIYEEREKAIKRSSELFREIESLASQKS